MKKLFGFIRWKFVVPTALVVGLLIAFFVFFFDPLLARTLEKIGSKINGAKVDVTNLNTQFFKGRLQIARVQVSDRKDPMTNRVEAGPLVFQLDFGQLLKKRVIIPESTAKGITFGTKRTVSGYIPPKVKKKKEKDEKPSAALKLANKYKNRFKLNLDGLKQQVNEKIEFDPKDLELTRQSEALKEKTKAMPLKWENKIEGLDFDGRVKNVSDDVESIKNTPTKGVEAITAIPKALEKLKKAKSDLNQIKSDVKSTKADLQKEITQVKSDVGGLKKAKKEDMDYLMSKLNLEFANPERLVEGLVGAALLDRLQSALRFIELAREHLPSKKEKQGLPEKPRAKGMDILFPRPADPPRFWLKKAVLSGQYKEVGLDGSLVALSSDPPRVGEPTVLKLEGLKEGQLFRGQIIIDHVTEVKKDSFVLEANNLRMEKIIGGGILGSALTSGKGNAEFVFSAIGSEKIGGHIRLALSKLKFDDATLLQEIGVDTSQGAKFEDNLKAQFLKNVARSIEEMKAVQIEAQLFGTWEDPDLKINTNLGPQLANVIKKSVGNAAKEQRKEIEKKLNQLLAEKTKDVQAEVDKVASQLTGDLGSLDSKVQKEIEKAANINLSPVKSGSGGELKIPSLDSIFK